MRKVAIPKGAEWIGLEGMAGRFYPIALAGSVVLVDDFGSVWAELFHTDRTNLLFRTFQPMSDANVKSAFSYLMEDAR
jgi:hypothetical protein